MSARVELTAMFAPFLSGTVLEEAVSEAYAVVMNEAADALEARVADVDVPDTSVTWAGMDAAYLRHLAAAPAAAPVPVKTAGELADLRELKRRVMEQLEDFEEGLEEDPGAPAVARNMTALLARAVRGDR